MPRVEVVAAWPSRARSVEVEMPDGATVRDALAAAGFVPLPGTGAVAGVHGRRVSLDAALEEGDRVELYRPLAADPREARRRRAGRRR